MSFENQAPEYKAPEYKAPERDEREEAEEEPEYTHYLHLANGEVVDHLGAIPTHVAIGDTRVPVAQAYER